MIGETIIGIIEFFRGTLVEKILKKINSNFAFENFVESLKK